MKYKASEVLQFVAENDVKFIRLAFCDIFGTQKNISILPEKLESADPRISAFWDQAILSTEDKIFPATNLRNYWQGRCPIQEIKAPHLPFYHYQSWNELWK